MRVMGIVGWSGTGKTTLIVRLLPILVQRGLQVSTVKHAHHRFDVDQPGKDSYEHRRAGATEVLVGSANRWALMHELRGTPEPTLDDLLSRMARVDLVLVEGFKSHPHDKIEVIRGTSRDRPLWRDDPCVIALATDRMQEIETSLPVLDLDEPFRIADFIVERCGLLAAEGVR